MIMGILNITPDSFYDGGRYHRDPHIALERIGAMLEAGADIIDVGGMSTRPGSARISVEEELDRVIPVIELAAARHPEALISIDTVHAAVAKAAVEAGACMVNDISAGRMDKDMIPAVAALNTPYILMHMKGDPGSMQDAPTYRDVALEVLDFLIEGSRRCRDAGIRDIIIDPGLGFGKSLAHNYELLHRLEVFSILELPVLIGASRKSMIYKLLNTNAEEALNGTSCVHMIALMKGASMLRVHDVRAARECLRIYEAFQEPDRLEGR